jgi:hypothetical protein
MFGEQPKIRDLPSRAVEHMFLQKQLPVWVTFAVKLFFASQDHLGGRKSHAYVELVLHLQKLARQNNRMVRAANPFLPDRWYDVVFKKLGTVLQECQDWVLFDGYKRQWEELSKKKQVATHPVLQQLLKGRPQGAHHLGDNAILCGMLKYEIYLEYRCAGLQLEQQTLSFAMLAQIYVTGHLEREKHNPPFRGWPDMEYMLYAQDPVRVFLGGRLTTVRKAQSKFLLPFRSAATNPKANIHKLKMFQNTLMFGVGVYLPCNKDGKTRHSVCTANIEDITKRLVDSMHSPCFQRRRKGEAVSTATAWRMRD